MPNSDATTKFRADISQLKTAMQQAQRSVRLANAEFKAMSSGLDNWSKSAEGLNGKLTQLGKVQDAQKKQLVLLERELELTVKTYGENSAAADNLRVKIENQKAAINQTDKEIDHYTKELEECQKETDDLGDETKETADQVGQMSDGFSAAKVALGNLVADGIRMAISALKDLAVEAFNVGMSFEQGMSKVKAISGASAEDMELLNQKAKEMGETTVFSATEASEAFQYMAMAGWKTEDMLNGIEGIMNLAAASGEDLATTSDIVTDALTAFGMTAADSGRFADILAAASSNANTNVSMLGESFKYVAPLAGAMGYSAEDVASALGLMANSGVKASSAGTALRTMLTNMANPSDKMATAMEDLGINLTDAEGNMKSLKDVMKELREGFKGLGRSQEEYENALASLDAQLEAGTITQKQYDSMLEDWINKTFTADEALKAQTASMLAGKQGLSGLMAIVNSSEEDFNKLTAAIEGSDGAAKGMAETMTDNVGGQITLLKSKVEGIMIKVFEKASGSIREAIDIISEALDNIDWDAVAEAIGNIAKKAAEFLRWCIKNSDVIIEIIKSIAKIMATLWVVDKVKKWATAINGVITTVKGFAAAMKGVEAASNMASTATGLFAKLISPGGAIVLGIAAVAAVTVSLINAFKKEKREIDVLTEAQHEAVQKAHEMKASYDEMQAARQESMAAVQTEFGYYNELKGELDSIVGANGRVKEGYEDRAAFIVTTLNEALGLEMQLQDGIIQNYAKERQAIDQVLESKKAEAILAANEAAYAEAIQKRTEAQQAYTAARETFNDVMARAEEYAVKVQEAELEYARIEREEGIEAALDYMYTQQDVMDTYAQLQQEVTNTRSALRDATDAYQGYNQTIMNYEGLSAAIISGDSQKINDALLKTQNSFKTANNTTADALKAQRDQYDRNYQMLKKAVAEGDNTVTQQMVDDAKKLADMAQAEYLKSGQQTVAGYSKGLKDNQVYAEQAAKNLGYGSLEEFNEAMGIHSPSDKTYSSGEFFAQGFINGMGSKSSAIYQKAYALAQQAINGLKAGQKEGSPSKITMQSGKFFGEGYAIGISDMVRPVIKSAKMLVTEAVESLDSQSLAANLKASAQSIVGDVIPLNFGDVSGIRQVMAPVQLAGGGSSGNTITNTYNLVQNNTSPKALSALQTYQARRQQIAQLKAMM